MRHGRLPLVWGGKGRGDRKGGKSYWGRMDYRNESHYLKLSADGVENSLSAYNLLLPHQVRFSSLIPVHFPSVYRDDLCRQFRKCRLNVFCRARFSDFFSLSSCIFTTLSDHRPFAVNGPPLGRYCTVTRQDTSTFVQSGLCAAALGLG